MWLDLQQCCFDDSRWRMNLHSAEASIFQSRPLTSSTYYKYIVKIPESGKRENQTILFWNDSITPPEVLQFCQVSIVMQEWHNRSSFPFIEHLNALKPFNLNHTWRNNVVKHVQASFRHHEAVKEIWKETPSYNAVLPSLQSQSIPDNHPANSYGSNWRALYGRWN